MKRTKTGEGYAYYRDRSGGSDVTVYEHQLVACLFCDPGDVFDPDKHVHHTTPLRGLNAEPFLRLVDSAEHAEIEPHVRNLK